MIGTSPSPDNYEGNVDTPYSMKSMMSTRSSKRQHAQATHTPAHWTPPYQNYTIVVASYSLFYVDFHFGDRRRANSTRPTFFPCRQGDSNPTAQKTPPRNSWQVSLLTIGEGYYNYRTTLRTRAIIGTDHGGTISPLRNGSSMHCTPWASPQGYAPQLTRDLEAD